MRRFFARLRNLLLPHRAEREMHREIASHLDLLQEDFERRGLSPQDAALAARRAYGGVDLARELHREARSFTWVEQIVKDVRYAWRNLMRNPGFTLLAVFALALGIGANASIFAVYNAVVLKQLPVADAGRVVRVKRLFEHHTTGDAQYTFAYPEYQYLHDRTTMFDGVVAASGEIPALASFSDSAMQEHVEVYAVSPNYFADLGVKARLGRAFTTSETDAVVVVSYRFWQQRFQSDANVLGQIVKLNGATFTVVGVAPPGFAGTDLMPIECAFWAPLATLDKLDPEFDRDWQSKWQDATHPGFQLLARLKRGVTRAQAQAEARVLLRQYLTGRKEPDRTISVSLPRTSTFGETDNIRMKSAAAAVWTMMTLVLLVACANVANMLLARGMGRQREIAIRLAVGASRGRVVRQLLTESVLLALLGGAVGIVLSAWAGRLLWLSLIDIVRAFHLNLIEVDVAPDARVILYGVALSIVTGILFGLAPALRFTRPERAVFAPSHDQSRLRGLLMGAQVAVSLMLLIVSADLFSVMLDTRSANPGFETRDTYLLVSDSDSSKIGDTRRLLRDRLATLPELSGTAIGDGPLMGNYVETPMRAANSTWQANTSYHSDGYFDTMGIGLVRGRSFTRQEADRGSAVAVISQATAKHFWAAGDPVGKHFLLDLEQNGKFTDFEVVGIAKDIRYVNIAEIDPSHVYLPAGMGHQHVQGGLVFRIHGDRAKALAAVQAAVEAVDRGLLPGLDLISFADGPLAMTRNFTRVASAFAVTATLLALLLAAVGVYGVMSFVVGQQTREIGIRMALGASSRRILLRVVIQGLRPVLFGSGVGFIGAAIFDFVSSSDQPLKDWMGFDPTAYGLLALVLFIALLAGIVPARRALRVDPVVALRHD